MKINNLKAIKFSFLLFFLVNLYTLAQEKNPTADKNHTGPITQEDFRTGSTADWFIKAYEAYKPKKKVLKEIKKPIKKYHIKVFMGTWCPDSRREVPKLLKLLDEVNFKEKHLEIYTMDRSKSTEKNYEEGLDIQRVPTIIFFDKNGKEVNRFVEFPQKTLEKDILKIVTEQPYKNVYAE